MVVIPLPVAALSADRSNANERSWRIGIGRLVHAVLMITGAGGTALRPQPVGGLPAAVCDPKESHATDWLRTIPPRENSGNRDELPTQVGATVFFLC